MSLKKTILKTIFLGGFSMIGLGTGLSILDRYEEAHKSKIDDGVVEAEFKECDNNSEDENENEQGVEQESAAE